MWEVTLNIYQHPFIQSYTFCGHIHVGLFRMSRNFIKLLPFLGFEGRNEMLIRFNQATFIDSIAVARLVLIRVPYTILFNGVWTELIILVRNFYKSTGSQRHANWIYGIIERSPHFHTELLHREFDHRSLCKIPWVTSLLHIQRYTRHIKVALPRHW